MRILVADDNTDVLDSLTSLFEAYGHTVYRAADGQTALEVAESFRPDAAILDIGMPRVDGYRVAERIRAKPWGRNVVLVAHTAWNGKNVKNRVLKAGFNQHCTKPADFDDLHRALGYSGE
jgi:CheY-like chemotaxis protein